MHAHPYFSKVVAFAPKRVQNRRRSLPHDGGDGTCGSDDIESAGANFGNPNALRERPGQLPAYGVRQGEFLPMAGVPGGKPWIAVQHAFERLWQAVPGHDVPVVGRVSPGRKGGSRK